MFGFGRELETACLGVVLCECVSVCIFLRLESAIFQKVGREYSHFSCVGHCHSQEECDRAFLYFQVGGHSLMATGLCGSIQTSGFFVLVP